jgi:hypothetical protein
MGKEPPQEIQELHAMQAETEEAIAPYSKGLDSNPDVLWAEAAAFVRRAQEDIFEAGRRFIVLKERLERLRHSNFIKELGARGLERTSVWRMMAITRRFANVSALQHLSKGKQILFLSATDEEIQQLEKTGKIWDIPQDELAGKSWREIKEAYNKARNKAARRKKQIENMHQQLEEKEQENEQLRAELDNIAAGNSTSEVFLEQFRQIEENIRENDRLLRYLVNNPAFQEDIVLQGKVIRGVDAMYLTYSHLNNLVRTIIDADV